jgi:hypothetical protein
LVKIEQMAQMPFAEHNNMVKTIPVGSNRPASPNIRFAMATVARSAHPRMAKKLKR